MVKTESTTHLSGSGRDRGVTAELVDVVARQQQLAADIEAMRKFYEAPARGDFTTARVLACLMTLMSLNQAIVRLAIAAAVEER